MNEEQIKVLLAILASTKDCLDTLSLAEQVCDESLEGKDHVVDELLQLINEIRG